MPNVSVSKNALFEELKIQNYTIEDFEVLCFDFGIELDDVVEEEGKTVLKIDIPANRTDLLSLEGLSAALNTFVNKVPPVKYTTVAPTVEIKIAKDIPFRPFVVGAVLRDMKFTPESYQSFIDLQEKLHNNICRKRTLVAIGTHDLDTIQAPFTYTSMAPEKIKFAPLNQTTEMDGRQLMAFYEKDRHLSKFLPIIREKAEYPVILDKNGVVCSLPPIINGNHSKITLDTRNVFVECTATDLTKAKVVLNTVVTMFSKYCKVPFAIEQVSVTGPDGSKSLFPDLSNRTMTTTASFINSSIGVNLSIDDILKYLEKMCLSGKVVKNDEIAVIIPPTRSDILHPCDIMEDVAIAFNFNNIPETYPSCTTIGAPLPINKLCDLLRRELAMCGWSEVLPLILCSHDENFANLRKKDDGSAVRLANPKTAEYQVVRTSLLPGLLKTLNSNKHLPLPLKIFETSDVVFKDKSVETQARNQRNIAGVYCGKSSGFEVVHGVIDRLFLMLNTKDYYIKESSDETFFGGRRADIYMAGAKIGVFGVLHPEVLEKFDISYPCCAFEMNAEVFL